MNTDDQRPVPTIAEIEQIVAPHGITRVGVASADILEETRAILHERKGRGLHDGMQFTYRNPDRSTDPRRALPDARSVIVAARPYLTDSDPSRPGTGVPTRVGRYAWVDHYEPLRVGLRAAAQVLRAAGHRALVFADDNSLVDRAVAQRAGLGWFGKNANLLVSGAGSFFVLGSIVTDATYEPNDTPAPDGCGSCVRCLEACPTGAIVASGVIDAGRCISWILQKPGPIPVEFRIAVDDRLYGCDDCQDACPISVRLGQRNMIDLDVEDEAVQAFVDAIELLGLDDATIEARHGRWWIAGREMRWLRRNALVVIGNRADPSNREARTVLERYRSDLDPVLAEHAVWADARLDERAATGS